MAYTQEQIEKAKTAGTIEELIAIAKTEGIELSEENAANLFAELRAEERELSETELDNVAGGCPEDTPDEVECPSCHVMNIAEVLGPTYCKNCGALVTERWCDSI